MEGILKLDGGIPEPQKPANVLQEKEAEKLRLIEEKKKENYAAFKQTIEKQYADFLADDSSLKQVQAHGVSFGGPGFIIELFVADFSKNSSLLIMDDIHKKVTPYAKILAVSEYNQGPKADWKVGDVVNIGDGYMNVQLNPMYAAWMDAKAANQRASTKPPPQYIKKIYSWILNGHVYAVDKAKYLMDSNSVVITEDTIRSFPGPYVFLVDDYNIGNLKITGNPWA